MAVTGYLSSFPLQTPRNSQIALCNHLDESSQSNALIHIGPTGVGKSAIAVTVANHSGSAFIISPNRIHVDQYEGEYPDLRVGRSAADHKCQNPLALRASCRETARTKKAYCDGCPFVQERNQYIAGPVSVSTIAYLIARLRNPVKDHPILPREWVIIDEVHKLEDDLIRHSGLSIRVEDCHKLGILTFPVPAPTGRKSKYRETSRRDETGAVIVPFVRDVLQPALVARIKHLAKIKESSVSERMFKDVQMELERWIKLADRIPLYFDLDPSEIVAWVELDPMGAPRSIQVKPFSVAFLYKRLIEPMGQRVLCMSATIPSPALLASRLDLPEPAFDEKRVCRVPSPFPPENHEIRYIDCGRMTYNEQAETFEKMIPVIREILQQHCGQRGIIHGHTNMLSKRLLREFGDRLILAASTGDDALGHSQALFRHRQKPDSVLVSPSMTEGVDLCGDDSVFQILIKTPFLPLTEPWIAAHKNAPDGSLWYSSQTASIVTQALGRSLRTMEDHCTSYILDGSFGEFFVSFAYGTNIPNSRFFPQPLRSMLQEAIDNSLDLAA
jgi:ATP-dependent DNA helicase DinG